MSNVYRDSSGRTLEDYPRPSVAVDTAVLTIVDDALHVLVVGAGGSDGGLRLPGTFLHPGETLADAVLRSLREKAGVTGLSPRQLRVFDDPARDPRGWVLSVAHMDVVPHRSLQLDPTRARLAPVAEVSGLEYQHDEIVAAAAEALRADYRSAPDPARLVDEPFTLRTLQRAHEAVAGEPLMRDAFRRAMLPRLEETGELERGGVGKPARLFRRGRVK